MPAQSVLTLSFATKFVNLDWTAAAGATSYRVIKTSNSGSSQLDGDTTGTTFSNFIAPHLTDWVNTNYKVQACNGSGCTG